MRAPWTGYNLPRCEINETLTDHIHGRGLTLEPLTTGPDLDELEEQRLSGEFEEPDRKSDKEPPNQDRRELTRGPSRDDDCEWER